MHVQVILVTQQKIIKGKSYHYQTIIILIFTIKCFLKKVCHSCEACKISVLNKILLAGYNTLFSLYIDKNSVLY